jgi:hypothetical protein
MPTRRPSLNCSKGVPTDPDASLLRIDAADHSGQGFWPSFQSLLCPGIRGHILYFRNCFWLLAHLALPACRAWPRHWAESATSIQTADIIDPRIENATWHTASRRLQSGFFRGDAAFSMRGSIKPFPRHRPRSVRTATNVMRSRHPGSSEVSLHVLTLAFAAASELCLRA